MAEKQCEFEYDGMRCTSNDVIGMARCKSLCNIHFNTVKTDNIRRFNKFEDIPVEMVFTKKLTNGESAPRLLTKIIIKEVEN